MKTQRKNTKTQSPSPQSSGRASTSVSSSPTSDARLKVLICLLLAAITLVAYWQVLGCKFIERWDDQEYVTNNAFIMKGLGLSSLSWALSTFHCGNWHPITWLSHMVDYQVYGLHPMGHHLTNLLFHIANALLLFLVLSRMTGSMWKSAFVAALFAVHPMHVESVAWVAERKDVLSIFFWLVTMYAYALYTERPCVLRYLPIVLVFGLALMSKPTPVSLPLVLLLMDYWPLNRANLRWKLVLEKVPLFALSAASCVMTMIAQRSGGAVVELTKFSVGFRVGNAAISYVAYIFKMLCPSRLAAFYPLFGTTPQIWQAVGAGIALAAVSVLALRNARRHPYLAVGWLWFLITLVPVIGLVQVGLQAMADRYSYITLTGLFIIVAWGIPELIQRRAASLSRLLPVTASVLIAILAICTWSQVGTWHDSYTVFDHAATVTRDNYFAYRMRGVALDDQGKYEEAVRDFSRAVALQPSFAYAHNSLGAELVKLGRNKQAIDELLTALHLGYDTALLRNNLACAYLNLGKVQQAADQCVSALRLDPSFPYAHNMLAVILTKQGKIDEGISHLKSAIALAPKYADPHSNLAISYYYKRDYKSAWQEVYEFQRRGGQPDPGFIADLSKRMPDPGR